MLLIFNKQWDELLLSHCPDISSSWLPPYSASFEMLMLSSLFSIQKWKLLPCDLGLRRKMDLFWTGSTFKSLVGFIYTWFLFNAFLKTVILISLETWTSWWAHCLFSYKTSEFWIVLDKKSVVGGVVLLALLPQSHSVINLKKNAFKKKFWFPTFYKHPLFRALSRWDSLQASLVVTSCSTDIHHRL